MILIEDKNHMHCDNKWLSYVKYPHEEKWEQGYLLNSWNIESFNQSLDKFTVKIMFH